MDPSGGGPRTTRVLSEAVPRTTRVHSEAVLKTIRDHSEAVPSTPLGHLESPFLGDPTAGDPLIRFAGGRTISVPDSFREVQERTAFTTEVVRRGTVSRVPPTRWSGLGPGLCLTPTLGAGPLATTGSFSRVDRGPVLVPGQGQGRECAQARGC